MLCVSFLGWDSRHNVWMDPPKADEVDPQIVFEPPAARRRAPERLFDEVQAQFHEEDSLRSALCKARVRPLASAKSGAAA